MKQSYISILNYNFGDALNEPILGALSSNKIDFVHYLKSTSEQKRISAIGSIAFLWTGNTIVWGSGVLDEKRTCPNGLKNMEFRCVRGPKTRQHLMNKGYVDIPQTYCDPGILAPYFYRDILEDTKKFDIGIFPHNTDNPEWHRRLQFSKGTKVIFLNYKDPIDITIRRMSMCKKIISSSLHGIIVSEVLGIPASWFRLTDDNDPFKFYDYFEGTNRANVKCIDIRNKQPHEVTFEEFENIPFGIYDLTGLLDSCPFEIYGSLKEKIMDFYRNRNPLAIYN